MEMKEAIPVLSALAQPTRYRCLAHLLSHGECTAGDLAETLGVPANSMSSHLTIMSHAGLVTSERSGRNIVYTASRGKIVDVANTLDALLSLPTER